MSSILTNTSAMVALQTLKGINSNLAKTQDEISTGKSVASSKDNAAVWAISKVMESDVAGFTAITDSLALGEETVAVARKASESVTDLLTKMQAKIVAAQGQNVDRSKLQTDIQALKDQIGAVAGAAQFNGLNLLSNTSKTAGTGTVNVLSSLDRSAAGVAVSNIAVGKQDLGSSASVITGTGVSTAYVSAAAPNSNMSGTALATTALTATGSTPGTTTLSIAGVSAGFGYSMAITAGGGSLAAGFNVAAAGAISYVARDGDTTADVAKGLAASFNDYAKAYTTANPTIASAATIKATVTGSTITFAGSNVAADTFSIQASGFAAAGNTIGGGLAKMAGIDVTTDAGASKALADIQGLISVAIDAAADFGSVQGRIETQSKFIAGLTDSLKAGIGTLVDADMEEASARLQALQVQQQLGVQALSIANQAPQSILSLFR